MAAIPAVSIPSRVSAMINPNSERAVADSETEIADSEMADSETADSERADSGMWREWWLGLVNKDVVFTAVVVADLAVPLGVLLESVPCALDQSAVIDKICEKICDLTQDFAMKQPTEIEHPKPNWGSVTAGMSTDEILASLMRKDATRALEDGAQATTAALLNRQSAFAPSLPPVQEPTDQTPLLNPPPGPTENPPSSQDAAASPTEKAPTTPTTAKNPKRKAEKGRHTTRETPPQKQPTKTAQAPKAPKATQDTPTPTRDAPQPAKEDAKCGKCGSQEAHHAEHGPMLLCSARPSGRQCNSGKHVKCAGLLRVPHDAWYCDEHTTEGAGCHLGCTCPRHFATGKRTRRPAVY